MVKSSIKEIHDTIKTMLSYALALSESRIPTVYELAHYLADNILAKVCLAVAIDKNEEQQTYTTRGWTKSLPKLYNDHLKNHYPQVPNYDPNIKVFHEERNVYQHDIESFDMTMRQPRAKSYVGLVEEIMRMVGIIKSGETIQAQGLVSSFGTYDFNQRQIRINKTKFQKLHDLLTLTEDSDLHIKLRHEIKDISLGKLKKILIMEGSNSTRGVYLHIYNEQWGLLIHRHDITITKDTMKGISYSLMKPYENKHLLNEFLKYFRDCCKEHGIDIKLKVNN